MSSTTFEKKDSTLNVWPDGRLDTATSPVLEKEVREQLDGVQHGVVNAAFFLALLYHGGQLFVVADKDEAGDSLTRKESYELRFKYLTGFVDDGQRELLDAEDVGARLQHAGGADDDTRLLKLLADVAELWPLAKGFFEQMRTVGRFARGTVAHAQERE